MKDKFEKQTISQIMNVDKPINSSFPSLATNIAIKGEQKTAESISSNFRFS